MNERQRVYQKSRMPVWRDMAEILGDRLAQHAQCFEHPTHHDVHCSYCLDREAYRKYAVKTGIFIEPALAS